jgi:hypothetical protein
LRSRNHLPVQSPSLPPSIESDDVSTQLCADLGHALTLWRTHPPSRISFDGFAVATHWSCPQAPLVIEMERRQLSWQRWYGEYDCFIFYLNARANASDVMTVALLLLTLLIRNPSLTLPS